MSLAINQVDSLNLGHIGWKYYNSIRKKAMEQEFSWSGLFTSLSIAFFIVIISASTLSFINQTIINSQTRQQSANKIYFLEGNTYLSHNSDKAINYLLIYQFT